MSKEEFPSARPRKEASSWAPDMEGIGNLEEKKCLELANKLVAEIFQKFPDYHAGLMANDTETQSYETQAPLDIGKVDNFPYMMSFVSKNSKLLMSTRIFNFDRT